MTIVEKLNKIAQLKKELKIRTKYIYVCWGYWNPEQYESDKIEWLWFKQKEHPYLYKVGIKDCTDGCNFYTKISQDDIIAINQSYQHDSPIGLSEVLDLSLKFLEEYRWMKELEEVMRIK